MTVVPFNEIRPETLQRLIEDFVTRDGAIQGHREIDLTEKFAAVLNQLRAGLAVIAFDEETDSCTILTKRELSLRDASDCGMTEGEMP